MLTLEDAIRITGKDVYTHLDRQAEIPVVTVDAPACQGDVSILGMNLPPAVTPIPAAGVVVVAGETGHTHTLHGPGMFDRCDDTGDITLVGTLTVPADVEVLLSHEEHGAFLIAPGTYRVGRQREWAGEWRRVQD